MKKEPVWTTKDGRKIPIFKMSDSHLLNTLRMCENTNIEYDEMLEWGLDPFWGPRGDGAQMAFEQELIRLELITFSLLPWIPILTEEVKRRGLTPLPTKKHKHPPKVKNIVDLKGGGTIAEIDRS